MQELSFINGLFNKRNKWNGLHLYVSCRHINCFYFRIRLHLGTRNYYFQNPKIIVLD